MTTMMEFEGVPVTMRRAEPHPLDALAVLELRNEPEARRRSLRSEEIPWETHWDWYRQGLESRGRVIFLFERVGEVLGYVRFDRVPSRPEAAFAVSIAVRPGSRGRGLGTRFLAAAAAAVRAEDPAAGIRAEVKAGNRASERAFEKAGFLVSGRRRDDESGEELVLYELP